MKRSTQMTTDGGVTARPAPRRGWCASVALACLATGFICTASQAQTDPCVVVDDGSGTVTLPPDGCPYLSPDQFHEIVDGLPAGTTIELEAIHKDFICRNGDVEAPQEFCNFPGGSLGGERETFISTLELRMNGTGDLAGFSRIIEVPITTEVHTGPRTPGEPVQTFPNDMFILQGSIFGDPDFDSLTLVGGTNNGMPSPGSTTLTQTGNRWVVDSFFDVTYRIDFAGAPGGALAGLSGSTNGTVRMQAAGTSPPIPAVSEWGMVGALLLTLLAATLVYRRVAPTQTPA